MSYKKDQNGFAIIYGLMVLFLVTVGGMSLLFVSGKDKESSGDYVKMREATNAANAAHNAFIGLCEEKPDSLVKLLAKFISDSKYKWLFTDNVVQSVNEKKIPLIPGQPVTKSSSFSAKILNYDDLTHTIQIETHGYCSNWRGEQKKTTGIYKLDGIKESAAPLTIPTHALYLGGGFKDCNSPLTIDGNVYAGKKINGSGIITVNGNFKTSTDSFTTDAPITVTGNTYIRGKVNFQQSLTAMGKTGIEGGVIIGRDVYIKNDLFLNGMVNPIGSNFKIFVDYDYTAKYKSGFNPSYINSLQTQKEEVYQPIDIASELGMTNANDEPPAIRSDLETYITNNNGKVYTTNELMNLGLNFDISGWNLENAYKATTKKWNNFMVIKVTSTSRGVNPGWNGYYFNTNAKGSEFSGKAIWILDGVKCVPTGWYSSTSESNTLIYLKNGSTIKFGFGDLKTFRGVIYDDSNEKSEYNIGASSKIHGAIIHKGEALIQGNNCHIKYDTDVLEELATLGLWDSGSSSSSSSSSGGLVVKDTKIRPHLLGINF